MSILTFDQPRTPRSGKSLKFALGAGAIAVVVAIASTLAANININSGPVEFGQGVAQTTACDDAIILTPHSTFDNSYGDNGDFLLSDIEISSLDSTAGHCAGKGLTIKAYGNSSSDVLATYALMDHGSSFSSDFGMIESSGEGTDNSSARLYLATPTLLASSIYKITLESSDTLSVVPASVMRLATGYEHTCFIMMNSTVKCWGQGESGELGNGDTATSVTPVAVSNLSGVIALSTGRGFTCALLSDHTVKCWGYNEYGQLGNNSFINSSIPVTVSGLSNVESIAAGGYHVCALITGGTVECWGYNDYGQLGDGNTADRSTPVFVDGLTDVLQVAVGDQSSCVLRTGGGVLCWGWNEFGQLGDGTTNDRLAPVGVIDDGNGDLISGAVQLTGAQTDEHFCVRYKNGSAMCWGRGGDGELGVGGSGYNSAMAVTVTEITDFAYIAAGWANTCGQRENGLVYCWGNNGSGQLGNGTTIAKFAPGAPLDLSNVTQINPGDLHMCALITEDTVYCWGANEFGQLGDGTMNDRLAPTLVQW